MGGATLQQGNPKKTELNFRNSLLMLTKNLPKKVLFRVLFIRMILDGIAGFKFLFEGQPKHLVAVLKAHFSFYQMFAINYNKRGTYQQTKYYFTKSIVLSYFIKKIHFFNELIKQSRSLCLDVNSLLLSIEHCLIKYVDSSLKLLNVTP